MARDFLVTTSTETLPVLSPGTVSTILDESSETGNEYGQPPVLHPFDVSPPMEAAYATQDVSALTPEQSQIVYQSAPSFQSSPQSRTTTNTQTHQYLSLSLVNIQGHTGIAGNERADLEAKMAAMSIVNGKMDAPTNISIADAYKMSADIAQTSWQRRWDCDSKRRYELS